jgi:hypothetical protein
VSTDVSTPPATLRTPEGVRSEAPLGERSTDSSSGGKRVIGGRFRVFLVVGTLVISSLVLYSASAGNDVPLAVARSQAISEQTLEREFGLRIDLLGVSAGGGLIDFRFTVLEPEKATRLLARSPAESSSENAQPARKGHTLPVLFVEDSNTLIEPRGSMSHDQMSLTAGTTYFILYPNPGGKIQDGTPVSIVLGGVRVEHVTATT